MPRESQHRNSEPLNTLEQVLVWISILLLCRFFVSCGTSQKSTEIKRLYNTEYIYTDSLYLHIDRLSVEDILRHEKLRALITIKDFSRPDSLGNQYVERETTIDLTNEVEINSSKSDSSNIHINRVTTQTETQILDEEIKEDIKKNNRPFPTWIWWVLGSLFVIFIIYKAKRFVGFS